MFATTASMMSRACRRDGATESVIGTTAEPLRRSLALALTVDEAPEAGPVDRPHRVRSVDGYAHRPVPGSHFTGMSIPRDASPDFKESRRILQGRTARPR